MISIIDYGLGNLGSIKNILLKLSEKAIITNDPSKIESSEKLILPGVGAFDTGMRRLNKSGLIPLLNHLVLEKKKPILGICLGVQLMTNGSEEGNLRGLGWFNAETVRFNFTRQNEKKLTVPHMGWNFVKKRKESVILLNLCEFSKFYFVHSYYLKPKNEEDVLLSSTYAQEFCSALERENIIGVQFHPEKSHKYGMLLFENFIREY